MLAGRLTRALPLFLGVGLALGGLTPVDAARYPNVKGSWVGTFTFKDGRPGGDASLFVNWQKRKRCKGALSARGYTGIPIKGTVSRKGKIQVEMRAGNIRGKVVGQLNKERNRVTGTWTEWRGKRRQTGTFVMTREEQ